MGAEIVRLGKLDNVIDHIPRGAKVHYRSGVWNPYNRITVEELSKCPEWGNGYGYDLDEKDGEYYISNPTRSDMW